MKKRKNRQPPRKFIGSYKKVCSCKSFDAFKQELNDCCTTLIVRAPLES